jgi:uncharacterized protein YjiS (DUF1127 family)
LIAVLTNPMEIEMSVSTLFEDTEFDTRAATANPVAVAFAAAARAVAAWRAERARHLAMTDLLGMEPHRLRDLGISVHDIQQAMRSNR